MTAGLSSGRQCLYMESGGLQLTNQDFNTHSACSRCSTASRYSIFFLSLSGSDWRDVIYSHSSFSHCVQLVSRSKVEDIRLVISSTSALSLMVLQAAV